MTAGKSVSPECPRCRAPQVQRRLTCRRCGQYLQSLDDSATQTPQLPVGVIGVVLVAVVGGFTCYTLLFPKPHVQPSKSAADQGAELPLETQASTGTSANAGSAATKKHGRRHRHIK